MLRSVVHAYPNVFAAAVAPAVLEATSLGQRVIRHMHGFLRCRDRLLYRSVAANSYDQVYCMQLAQNAVHGAMAGYTAFSAGMVNDRMVSGRTNGCSFRSACPPAPPGGKSLEVIMYGFDQAYYDGCRRRSRWCSPQEFSQNMYFSPS